MSLYYPCIFVDLASQKFAFASVSAFLSGYLRFFSKFAVINYNGTTFAADVVFISMKAICTQLSGRSKVMLIIFGTNPLDCILSSKEIITSGDIHYHAHPAGNSGIVYWKHSFGVICDLLLNLLLIYIQSILTDVNKAGFAPLSAKAFAVETNVKDGTIT